MDPIAAISGVSNSAAGGEAAALGRLDSDAFLQLLVAQLRYQNPLSPTDGAEFMAQTAQFTTVETLKAIADIQQRLIGLQQVDVALGMVGHEVTAVDTAGRTVAGEVDAVRFGADGPILDVGGAEVRLDDVIGVEDGDQEPVSD